MILLMDGVKYEEWPPADHDEAALAEMVKEHYRHIFGEDSIYFDIKTKISGSSVAAIPDGYAVTFNPDQWWVVEVELSSHDVYGHIQPQIGKFLAAIGQPRTRAELKKRLYQEIIADEHMKLNLQRKKGGEIFKFLSDLLDQPPKVAIIIDRMVPALEDLALPVVPEIVEFRTFCQEGVGLGVHIHQFEPLTVPESRLPPGSWSELWEELLNRTREKGVPVPAWQKPNNRDFQQISISVGGIHFEWTVDWGAIGVELHFERTSLNENEKLLKGFEEKQKELGSKIGEPLVIVCPWRKRWARFYVFKKDPTVTHTPLIANNLKQWAVDTMVKFYHTCKPLLDSLLKGQGE